MASDGVWDAFEKTSKIPVMSRAWSVSVRRLDGCPAPHFRSGRLLSLVHGRAMRCCQLLTVLTALQEVLILHYITQFSTSSHYP